MKKTSFYITACILTVCSVSIAFADPGHGKGKDQEKHDKKGENNRSSIAQCIQDARVIKTSCQRSCENVFKESKGECGLNSTCIKGCKAQLETCLTPFVEALNTCKEGCVDTREAAVDSCKESSGCADKCYSNAVFLQCIRPALLTEFTCKRDCADAQKLDATAQAGITACKEAFKVCKQGCRAVVNPTATPAGGPTPGPAPEETPGN